MKDSWRALGALMVMITLVAVGCGDDDSESRGAGQALVEVAMVDIAYEPDHVTVPAGEEITFRFTNDGAINHEATIGTAEEQEAHAQEMAATGDHEGMDHGGADDPSLTLGPGASGELTHVFAEPGEYLIGCHVPGHYEAGMVVTVTVE
jgi:uncharacterized cupredoxin-like copper-binding protein